MLARPRVDVAVAGEAMWDLTGPRGRSFAEADDVQLRPGGAAVNVARALAKRGLSVGLAMRVGRDMLGDALVARLEGEGIVVLRAKAPRTPLFFADVRAKKTMSVRSQGDDEIARPTLDARWFHFTGVTPSNLEGLTREMRAARRRDAIVSLDLNARPRFWKSASQRTRRGLLEAARDADLVQASSDDLALLHATPRDLVRRTSGSVVVTDGRRSALAFGAFGEIEVEVKRRSEEFALGAGDAFAADLIASLCVGGLDRAVTWKRALASAHRAARRHLEKRSAR